MVHSIWYLFAFACSHNVACAGLAGRFCLICQAPSKSPGPLSAAFHVPIGPIKTSGNPKWLSLKAIDVRAPRSFDSADSPSSPPFILFPTPSNMAPRTKSKDHRRKKGPIQRNGRVRKTSWRQSSLSVSQISPGISPLLTSHEKSSSKKSLIPESNDPLEEVCTSTISPL